MSQTLELPDDLAEALSAAASRLGISMPDYAIQLLGAIVPTPQAIRTGSELVEYWKSEGLIGTRSDIADSQECARQLREHAQRRGA
jgi:hypothetical protein